MTPPYLLDALVRRAQEAGAAALLVVAGAARPLLSGVRLAERLQIPVLWLENDDPVRLVQELTARVRPPGQVRARTVERLLKRLSGKRGGQEILATAEAELSARLSLLTPDGTGILGGPVSLDPALHLNHPVRSAVSTSSSTPYWTGKPTGWPRGWPALTNGLPSRAWTCSQPGSR